MADWMQFERIPGGGIRPKQVPASDIYGPPKFDLPQMFANLFGGDKQSTAADFDAVSGAAPPAQNGSGLEKMNPRTGNWNPATSAGALPSNSPPAAAQGGLPGDQPAAAPALAGAQQPPASPASGGAGSGPEMIKQEVDRAKQGAKAAPEKAKRMADALEGTGVDLTEAYNEIFDQLGGVEKPDTELSKEEKGLFIMSFGLRMMAASETMSAGGAFGAAGVPTVQEMRGLKESRRATAQEQTEQRRKRALDILSERVRQREGALDRAANPQTYDSASGLRTWNPQTGAWEQSLDPNTGQPIQPGMTPGGHNRPLAHRDKFELLKSLGYSDQLAGAIAVGNAPTDEEMYLDLSKRIDGMKNTDRIALPDGTTVKKKDLTPEQIDAWIYDRIQKARTAYLGDQGQQGGGLGQAQPGLAPQQPGGPPPGTQGITPPPVGTVEDGFVFKGGDPSDPRNWQRQ